jgi:hypothetical protein
MSEADHLWELSRLLGSRVQGPVVTSSIHKANTWSLSNLVLLVIVNPVQVTGEYQL